MAITYVCERCGCTNVTSDTAAEWDVSSQHWKIVGHYDSSECLDCELETHLTIRELIAPEV